jgi:hypothetical protein
MTKIISMGITKYSYFEAWLGNARTHVENRYDTATTCVKETVTDMFAIQFRSTSGRWDMKGLRIWIAETVVMKGKGKGKGKGNGDVPM